MQVDSLLAEPQGKSKNTGVGSLSPSRGSSWPRNRTGVSCIAGRFFPNELSGKPFRCVIQYYQLFILHMISTSYLSHSQKFIPFDSLHPFITTRLHPHTHPPRHTHTHPPPGIYQSVLCFYKFKIFFKFHIKIRS